MVHTLSYNQKEIVKVLLYFDVFKYPLTITEIFENTALNISKDTFANELKELIDLGFLKQVDDFVLSPDAPIKNAERRINGNNKAKAMFPTAYHYSKKIASFPFVEGICLSGGISKNFYDKEGDIDYLIITKPNRLWICRTLLILRYKLLSPKSKKYWCVNYFIGSNNLFIPEKNTFVATEIAFLIPTINFPVYQKLMEQNSWHKTYYANKPLSLGENCIDTPAPFFKRVIETVFSSALGEQVDNFLLKITLKHWQKKYPDMPTSDFELQFRSKKNACKRHTHGHQNKALDIWNEKISEFEKQYQVSLK